MLEVHTCFVSVCVHGRSTLTDSVTVCMLGCRGCCKTWAGQISQELAQSRSGCVTLPEHGQHVADHGRAVVRRHAEQQRGRLARWQRIGQLTSYRTTWVGQRRSEWSARGSERGCRPARTVRRVQTVCHSLASLSLHFSGTTPCSRNPGCRLYKLLWRSHVHHQRMQWHGGALHRTTWTGHQRSHLMG